MKQASNLLPMPCEPPSPVLATSSGRRTMMAQRSGTAPSPTTNTGGSSNYPGAANGSTLAGGLPATADLEENVKNSNKEHHIWVVTGPSGCGKTTIGSYLADSLHLPYLEGDDYHSPENIDKMTRGISLQDEDRWDWLTSLRDAALRQLASGANGVVLSCSALKRKYRDVIRVAPYFSPNLHLHLIYLHAPGDVIRARVAARTGHYFTVKMVDCQLRVLERPDDLETDVMMLDVSGPMDQVCHNALDKVLAVLDQENDKMSAAAAASRALVSAAAVAEVSAAGGASPRRMSTGAAAGSVVPAPGSVQPAKAKA